MTHIYGGKYCLRSSHRVPLRAIKNLTTAVLERHRAQAAQLPFASIPRVCRHSINAARRAEEGGKFTTVHRRKDGPYYLKIKKEATLDNCAGRVAVNATKP